MINIIIILTPMVAITNHKSVKPFIPLPRRLLQTINRFLQQINMVFLSQNNESLRLMHINLFFQLTM